MITKPLLFIFLTGIISANTIHYHYYNMNPKQNKTHMSITQPCTYDHDCSRYPGKYCYKAPWYVHDHCVDKLNNGEKCNRARMCKSLVCKSDRCSS